MRSYILIALFTLPFNVHAAARISTYLEGRVVVKTVEHWVLQADEGLYWIKVNRPVSWLRRSARGRISFWVPIDQIKRFRPSQVLLCKPEYKRPAHDAC